MEPSVHILSRRSLLDSPSFSSPTPIQIQVDGLVGGFVQQATDWRSLAAMMVGGMAYRLGRIGVMSTRVGAPLRIASVGIGLGAEVTAFEMTNRSLSSLTGETHSNPNLWRWDGQGGIRQGLLSSFLTFGTLKGAGRLAAGENIVVQHLLQDSAMVMGHQLAGAFQIIPRPAGDLAEQFLAAEAVNLQLQAGMSLVHGLSPGVTSLERALDLSVRGREREIFDGGARSRPVSIFSMVPALAGNSRNGAERPSEPESAEGPPLAMMVKGREEGGGNPKKPNALSSLLYDVSRIRDLRSIKIALRIIHSAIHGPLRDEIRDALLAIAERKVAGPLVRTLSKDPRTHQTIFLSKEAQTRITNKINELKLAGPARESGTYYFDSDAGIVKTNSPSSESPKPPPSPIDELDLLNRLRLQELERLLELPDDEPFPFSAKEAIAEGVKVGKHFDWHVRREQMLANIDSLTGFLSRKGLEDHTEDWEQRLRGFMRRSDDEKKADYVLMLDIDHFKKVNDTYGHLNGDVVLQEVAQLIRKIVRARDVRARWGGEEFFILLAKSGREGAELVAEKIRRAIEEHLFEIEVPDPLNPRILNTVNIKATISVGVAQMRPLPPHEEGGAPVIKGSLEDAIKRADLALYESKNTGRNRVTMSSQ